jgi:NitT/TauT family transport system permease protein
MAAAERDAGPSPQGDNRRGTAVIAGWLPIVAGAAVVLVLWRGIVALGDYPAYVLPTPEAVFGRLVRAWQDGLLQPEIAATLTEIVLGFSAGAITALIVGALLARWRVVELVLSPYLVAAQTMPILALAPLITLWFGTGLGSKVIICALIVFFPIAVATMVGFRRVDPGLVEMARSFAADGRDVLVTVEVPAALPVIFGGIRVGVTLSVVGAIVAEWSGAEHGLGVLINLARGSLFDTPLMFAALFTIAALGVALYVVVSVLERAVVGSRS